MEAIRGEKTVAEIASAFGGHPQQVAKWKKQALEELPEVMRDRRNPVVEEEPSRDYRNRILMIYNRKHFWHDGYALGGPRPA